MIKCEKKAKTILNGCNRRQRRAFCDRENVHVFNIASICFHEKNYSDNWHSIKNTDDLTMKQMFDISEKLITEQSDEIYGVKTVNWENSSWKYLSLVGDEQVISLGKMNENPRSNIAWGERLAWFKSSPEYRTLDRIDGEPIEFEWNIFPGFTTLQLSQEVQELLLRLSETPDNLTGRIIFMSMFNDISWGSKRHQERIFSVCKKIRNRTMVIPRAWIREKVVFYQ